MRWSIVAEIRQMVCEKDPVATFSFYFCLYLELIMVLLFFLLKKPLRSHSSISDREESLDECEEPVEEKRRNSDHRVSTPINESSEDEAEVRVTLKKSLQLPYFKVFRRNFSSMGHIRAH